MHAELGDKPAPSSKDNPETIKAFFAKVLPGYDRDRFYVSHMKKVLDWYSNLARFGSLEFIEEEEEKKEEAAE